MKQMSNYETLFKKINALKYASKQVFIYGHGSYGRNLYRILKKHGIDIDGFIVTDVSNEEEKDAPLYQASQWLSTETGFIVALNDKSANEVCSYLRRNGIDDRQILNAGQYMMGFGKKRGVSKGSFEIVTVIGCPVDCRYCPQSLFLSSYYQCDKKRIKQISFDTFRFSLKYFPQEYDISFGGMSEPFLHNNFMEMLEEACLTGRRVSLYTTLVGLDKRNAEKLVKLNIENVVVHVADKKGYAKIPLTEEYFSILKYLVEAQKRDGTSFINMINAQSEPNEIVAQLCDGRYEILTEMTDRAGVLSEEGLIAKRHPFGEISCWNIGENYLNCILLPDGTVLLCCMDWGMKHILGNIFQQTYNEILSGDELQKVRRGMMGDTNIDILCRRCSYARKT